MLKENSSHGIFFNEVGTMSQVLMLICELWTVLDACFCCDRTGINDTKMFLGNHFKSVNYLRISLMVKPWLNLYPAVLKPQQNFILVVNVSPSS